MDGLQAAVSGLGQGRPVQVGGAEGASLSAFCEAVSRVAAGQPADASALAAGLRALATAGVGGGVGGQWSGTITEAMGGRFVQLSDGTTTLHLHGDAGGASYFGAVHGPADVVPFDVRSGVLRVREQAVCPVGPEVAGAWTASPSFSGPEAGAGVGVAAVVGVVAAAARALAREDRPAPRPACFVCSHPLREGDRFCAQCGARQTS